MKAANRILAVLFTLNFALSLCSTAAASSLTSGAMSNIGFSVSYTSGQFSDVDESGWYGENGQQVIGTACRLGLMKGSGTDFCPEATVTVAEAVTMAARLHNLYYGSSATFAQGAVWYQVYLDYAVEQGIIQKNDFTQEWTRPVKRGEMAYIFGNALPEKELAQISSVELLPDVDGSTHFVDSIYLLYRAGILTGDETGAFHPDASIDRASAAAILARVALPEMRKTFTLAVSNEKPVWSEVYAACMAVETLTQLEFLYDAAVYSRVDSFQVTAAQEVLDAFMEGGVRYPYNVKTVHFQYGAGLLSISITYSLFGEVEALGNYPDAESRASEAALGYQAKLDAVLAGLVGSNMTDREKCKAIHDYMVNSYEYEESPTDTSYSFSGLLDRKTGVCKAYMELFYLLANRVGVYCGMVKGTADGNGTGSYAPHGWNVVYLDGSWYHIDVTFDDPIGGTGIVYDYFLVKSDEISKDHTW